MAASHPLLELSSPNTVRNLQQVFENGQALTKPDTKCLGHRTLISKNPVQYGTTFEWQSYATVDARRRALGSGINKLFKDGVVGGGILPTVGIWSRNTPSEYDVSNISDGFMLMLHVDWQIIDLSLHLYNLVSVALYDTLGKDSVGKYCVSQLLVQPFE